MSNINDFFATLNAPVALASDEAIIGNALYEFTAYGTLPDRKGVALVTGTALVFVEPTGAVTMFDKSTGAHLDATPRKCTLNGDELRRFGLALRQSPELKREVAEVINAGSFVWEKPSVPATIEVNDEPVRARRDNLGDGIAYSRSAWGNYYQQREARFGGGRGSSRATAGTRDVAGSASYARNERPYRMFDSHDVRTHHNFSDDITDARGYAGGERHTTSGAAGAGRSVRVAVSTPVRDGMYSVVFDDGTPHRTLRVKTAKQGALAGKRIVSFLSGSDNDNDYTGFGFIDDRSVSLWKKFSTTHSASVVASLVRALEVLVGDPAQAGLNYAIESGRCCRCNRTLTVPASVNQGMGDDCAAKAGM